jgi:hypothetical protein
MGKGWHGDPEGHRRAALMRMSHRPRMDAGAARESDKRRRAQYRRVSQAYRDAYYLLLGNIDAVLKKPEYVLLLRTAREEAAQMIATAAEGEGQSDGSRVVAAV